MASRFRGERFELDLPSDDEDPASADPVRSPLPLLVKDVSERPVQPAAPPTPPSARAAPGGFPVHKKRTQLSKFKQVRNSESSETGDHGVAVTAKVAGEAEAERQHFDATERREIDKENRQRLAHMSDAEIAKERQELMSGLSPSLIQRLLRRANIDDQQQEEDFPAASETANVPDAPVLPSKPPKRVTFDTLQEEKGDADTSESEPEAENEEDAEDTIRPPSSVLENPRPSIHFPTAPQPPDLDPSSPNFFEELHEKYFPSLPRDPSKLAWMTADDPASDADSEYSTALDSVPIASLRFSFNGTLLPPRLSANIPITRGLHHHGDAPEAAGYTIPELAHLARSSFPTQRCVAYQTLGRVLYRLGKGEFGRASELTDGEGSDLARGLWKCVKDGRVLETLQEEAGRESGHVSAKAYAVEALWLWRQGGGYEMKAE